jgi:flagellar motor switch protein FliM
MTPVRTHDFHQADTLDRQHIRTLNAALDTFARHGSVGLSTSLRKTTQLAVAELHERPWREVTEALGERPYLATFNLDPLHGVAILSFALETANRMLDFRLGGGARPSFASHTNMTDTDFAILESTITPLLSELSASISRMSAVTAPLVSQESTVQFMQFAAAGEMFLEATFDLAIGDDPVVPMTIAMPFALVRQIFETALTLNEAPDNPAMLIDESVLMQAPLEVWLEIPPIQLPSSDVAEIKVGDVIRFYHPLGHALDVRAEGVLVARAKRGAVGSKIVCSILEEVAAHDN